MPIKKDSKASEKKETKKVFLKFYSLMLIRDFSVDYCMSVIDIK